ncbi:MAG: aminotransferase class I/II-fold pyridoxal phosphate-dependent enzyme [Alistipes sp.]|jgi:threonine-phosphate decarboxylase|nr:aminotransferase class I/II-fold pyridoxal phosphate-dependent enzyme [Alistipes sp.]
MIEGHGDDRYKYGDIRADFSSNIPSSEGGEGGERAALREHLSARLDLIERYPEPEPYTLERELAAAAGLEPTEVMATNGATEAIYLVAHLLGCEGFVGAGFGRAGEGRAAIVEPTFAEYADACRLHGLDPEAISEPWAQLPEGCGSLWCCNPNNPTGRAWERERLLRAIEARPEVMFVVDQSYEAFTRRPTLSAAEAVAHPNVILIRSMTKRYAVPGLRIGYLVAAEEVCRRLRRLRMPWSVNALAIEAGRFLLRRGGESFSLDGLLGETARLAERLREVGASRGMGVFVPLPTDTHFMLVEMGEGTASGEAVSAAELKEWLAREEGILIRNADNFRGLTPRHFRIATQSVADNDLLITALERWISR